MPRSRAWAAALAACGALLASAACSGSGSGTTGLPETLDGATFAGPFPVQITGYTGHAMEPFLTRNGQYLVFNNRNGPADSTDLHIARRVNDSSFAYIGRLAALNSPVLDAVAAGASDGTTYFVSLRSYTTTFSTIYRATLTDSVAGAPSLVSSVTTGGGGFVDFDVDVSADGQSLTVARGRFTGGSVPVAADLVLYTAAAGSFVLSPGSTATYAAVNSAVLEYAPATSGDGLWLSFTRLDQAPGSMPTLLVARRASTSAAWGEPSRITAPAGLVEAGTWSPDGRVLYYHAMVAGTFVIQRVRR